MGWFGPCYSIVVTQPSYNVSFETLALVRVKSAWNPKWGIHSLSRTFTTDMDDWSFLATSTVHFVKTSVRTRMSSLPSAETSNLVKSMATALETLWQGDVLAVDGGPHQVSWLFGGDDLST